MIKINQLVTIYDDGKLRRGVSGRVVSIIDDDHIVVQFTPYGWTKEIYLVFYKNEYGDFEALNPCFLEWKKTGDYYDSEYCLIRKQGV